MGGWEDGRMVGWKHGRMETWEDGRMGGREDSAVRGPIDLHYIISSWMLGQMSSYFSNSVLM